MTKSTKIILLGSVLTIATLVTAIAIQKGFKDHSIDNKHNMDGEAFSKHQKDSNRYNQSNRVVDRKLALLAAKQSALQNDLDGIKENIEHSEENHPTGEDDNTSMSHEEREEQIISNYEQRLALLDELVVNEKRDPEWTSQAEETLHNALENKQFASVLGYKANCNATFCKIKMDFDAERYDENDVRILTNSPPWNGAVVFKANEQEATIFLSREGYRLPRQSADDVNQ